MAELTAEPVRALPSLAGQLRAIGWLRWRILANGFRRKGGAGELIARILMLPIFALVVLAPTALAGIGAWVFVADHHPRRIVWILWAAFAFTQVLNINLGQPGTTFDPTELIRFPMRLRRYVLVRLSFGLLGPANVIVGMISVAVVAGVTVAEPRLFVPSALAMIAFALTNVLFTRMVFAWVDRWLSTRRAREIFTACIFLGSLGLQYVNVRYNPGFQHNRTPRYHRAGPGQAVNPLQRTQPAQALNRLQRAEPYARWLPPELATGAIVSAQRGQVGIFAADTAACAAFGLLFLSIYSLRMRTELRGENLSDVANAVRSPAAPAPVRNASVDPPPTARSVPVRAGFRLVPATLAPLLAKELLVLRRNIGLFYGLVAPAVMVFLFAGRMSARSGSHWVLLGAVAYAMLGISALSYNSFGTEGTGAQLYFFAPVSLREVFFAKNVFALLLALADVVLVVAVVCFVAGRPSPADLLFALLWALGALLLNTTLGNLRSVSAPKRVNPGRTMNKAQSAVSGWIAMAILAGCAGFGFGCELLASFLGRPWLGTLLMTLFAGAALVVYAQGLRGIEAYAMERRDLLFEELGKKT